MSATLFKKVDYSLSKLIHDVDYGDIGLPDIQRPFVWTPTKVRDLFDSMYNGFPVGYLLFWATESSGARPIGTSQHQRKVPRLLVVDGQQRLTSLFAVLRGQAIYTSDYQLKNIRIAFHLLTAKFAVSDAAIQKDAEYIPDISILWAEGSTSFKVVKNFFARLGKAREISVEEEERISASIDRLYDLQNYPFTAMEISASVGEEQVADIFVRINSKGVQLNQADFILTLLSVFWDEGRSQLEAFSRESRCPSTDGRPSPYNPFIEPAPDQLLRVAIALGFKRARLQQVYSILRGKDLETGVFSDERRIQQFAVLQAAQEQILNLSNWHEFLKVLIRAGYRSSSMISSETAVIYTYAMYLIGQNDYQVQTRLLRDVMARWFFMVSTTGRYSSSPESIMDQDLSRLRGVRDADGFIQTLDTIIDGELTNDFWEISLPNSLETSAARSPYIFAYYAALNLLNARVLFSNMRVTELLDPALRANRNSIERHHLFPKAYLKREGYEDIKEFNQAANFALVEWGDNAKIADTPPSHYVSQFEAFFSPEEMEQMHWWHALPQEWQYMSYPDFLAQRRRLIGQVTREGFAVLTRN